jgi:TPR repeat protein
MYENGDGVNKDLVVAVSWLRKAAEQGNADAKKRLAELGY